MTAPLIPRTVIEILKKQGIDLIECPSSESVILIKKDRLDVDKDDSLVISVSMRMDAKKLITMSMADIFETVQKRCSLAKWKFAQSEVPDKK